MLKILPFSDDAAIEAVRNAVEDHGPSDVAQSPAAVQRYILLAAQNIGRFEPFTPREKKLNTYLHERMAGQRLCDFAWRMLAQS